MLDKLSSSSFLPVLVLISFFGLYSCAKPQSAINQPSQEAQITQNNSNAELSLVDERLDDKSSASKNLDIMSDQQADAWMNTQLADDKVSLAIGATAINVEYADNAQQRALGLMFRKELCEDCGMLFKFDSPRIGSIWMKNTYVALDLAYIDSQGTIVDIMGLTPHDLTPVRSSSEILYALEMNQGWFAKQDIRVGDKVAQLP